MDTSRQPATVSPSTGEESASAKRQRWTSKQKRQIVEETLVPGASVARVARSHGVNANQVFYWRKQHLAGRLGNSSSAIRGGSASRTPGYSLRFP
jgi:transposase-like protein